MHYVMAFLNENTYKTECNLSHKWFLRFNMKKKIKCLPV